MTEQKIQTKSHESLRRHLLSAAALIVILVFGMGGWAATVELSGAVITSGQVVVDSNVKKVQHPTGGIVGELRVRDGYRVKEGDIVVRLDETQTKANLLIVTKSLDELAARQAREEAEREGADQVLFPRDLLARIDDPDVAHVTVHTVGGVITSQGDPIMLIVPENEALSIETKVQPQDIDQLKLGQPAVVRFTAFNQRTTPELNGALSRLSADVSEDQKTGTRYYTIRIAIPDSEIVRLGGLKLVPGMPVEAFIQTTPRTMISYLIRPIHDQVMKAFREK